MWQLKKSALVWRNIQQYEVKVGKRINICQSRPVLLNSILRIWEAKRYKIKGSYLTGRELTKVITLEMGRPGEVRKLIDKLRLEWWQVEETPINQVFLDYLKARK